VTSATVQQPNETIQQKYKTGELDNFEKLLVQSYKLVTTTTGPD